MSMPSTQKSNDVLKKVSLLASPVEQIYETLKLAILNLELAPGERVSEARISREVGVSRTPVRAALARLVEEGLIMTLPSRGNYVTLISANMVRQASFVRDALETAAVRKLAKDGLQTSDAITLDANILYSERTFEGKDYHEFGRLDNAFHELLANAAGHTRLVQALVREKAQLTRLRALTDVGDDAYLRALHDEHVDILKAIQARNGDKAQRLMSSHIGRVLITLDELQGRNREFFQREST